MSGSIRARETALMYLRRGWSPIPVPHLKKKPGFDGWQKLRLTEADLDDAFPDRPMNVSVLLGHVSSGLADVDLDVPLAIALADHFLPRTEAVFGRRSARRSHRLYQLIGPAKTMAWEDPTIGKDDPERGMLLELRFSGHTLFPGSTHPSGEPVTWDADGDPLRIETADLVRGLHRLATAVLLARHWPPAGLRHKAALALAGGLLRAGWSIEETEEFLQTVAHAAGDDETDDRIATVVSSDEAQAAGKHTTGWPTLANLIDSRVVDKVIAWLDVPVGQPGKGERSYERSPSLRGLDPVAAVRSILVPPFPLHVFPPRIRAYIERGAYAVGCPPDLVAVPFLSYAASAMGKTRLIRIKHRWQHKPTIWTAVVAASGDGKSPADGYARAALDELQSKADERYQDDLARYKQAHAQWKASDPKGRGEEPQPPIYEHWYSTDATVESLAPMLHHNVGLALACDELVAWAKGCNAYKKTGNDRQKYLEIWNGRALKVDRKTQGVIFVKDPVLCIAGGIQPSRVNELVRDATAHDGLVQRFFWAYPDVTPADWQWDDIEIDDLDFIVALFRSLRRPPNPLGPFVVRPDAAAKVVWKSWYDEVLVRRATLAPLAREFASKYPAHLARLWLLLTTLWEPDATTGVASCARLHDAIELMAYFDAHARRVLVHFGTATATPETGLMQRVRSILEAAELEDEHREGWRSKTEIIHALGRNVRAADLDDALASLLASDIVESRSVPTESKPRTEFRLRVEESSYEEYEVFDPEGDHRVQSEESSNNSYELSPCSSVTSPACSVCGVANWSADGVCRTCTPDLEPDAEWERWEESL